MISYSCDIVLKFAVIILKNKVQKTSHRIGRIIHEKDIQKEVTLPNPFGLASSMAAYIDDEDEVQMDEGNPIVSTTTEEPALTEEKDNEQTIADILKHPSKILLLKVGRNF